MATPPESSGLTLPVPVAPLGNYRAFLLTGAVLHISMQGPMRDGATAFVGKVGQDIDVDAAREATALAALNALAQIDSALGGFDRLETLIRLDGYVACDDAFTDHPRVLDAASDLLVRALGDRGQHVRTVCGVRNLPGNAPVALALTASVRH